MKAFIVIIAALAVCALAEEIVYFKTDNDDLDVDEVMKHADQVKTFMDCFLDKSPCDALGQSYKNNMPESLSTVCRRCNDKQKHLWARFLRGLQKYYPEYYEAYQKKYDPKNLYLAAFENALKDY